MRRLFLFLCLVLGSANATPAGEATGQGNPKVLMLIGAFVVGLIIFVWIAGKLMGNESPADDDHPLLPFGIGDEEDRQQGDN